ncbi:TOX high mobility group box family member 3 [Pteropus alecto]|uniref:TOX high mobility group box family member 3 n=1 Tax=Pteropus alecto TaxID=9402 RepID=L5KW39_PTEAL|nr:TOX high mobility group box family member 3 [Pteropus alecto]
MQESEGEGKVKAWRWTLAECEVRDLSERGSVAFAVPSPKDEGERGDHLLLLLKTVKTRSSPLSFPHPSTGESPEPSRVRGLPSARFAIKPLLLFEMIYNCFCLITKCFQIESHSLRPHTERQKFANNNNYMNMAEANNAFFAASEQTFHTPSLGDEEFEIPPITPPPESEPALGMPDVLLPFQGLGDPVPSQGSEFTPQFPPQSLDLPSITISRNLVEQDGVLHSSGLHMDQSHTQVSQYRQDPSLIMRSIVHMTDAARSGVMPSAQLTTINQSQLSAQLGLNLGGASMPHTSPSPPASKSATPSPSSSINEEDADEASRAIGEKRAAPDSGKKPKTPKKKKKKDPNEPQKPVSAYALFFRDTQAAIKGQNPNATFGEVSKIVASMWDSLGEEQKQVYKRKTEAAKKEYLKALAAYRASLVSKAAAESAEAQTIRSVQQTLASTNLTSSLLLNPPLSQHGTVSASPQTLQQSLPRSIAPKPLTMRLPMNQIVTSVTIAANMPSNIGAPLISSMGTTMVGSASSAQMTSPIPAIGSPQPSAQQPQTQTQVLSQARPTICESDRFVNPGTCR